MSQERLIDQKAHSGETQANGPELGCAESFEDFDDAGEVLVLRWVKVHKTLGGELYNPFQSSLLRILFAAKRVVVQDAFCEVNFDFFVLSLAEFSLLSLTQSEFPQNSQSFLVLARDTQRFKEVKEQNFQKSLLICLLDLIIHYLFKSGWSLNRDGQER